MNAIDSAPPRRAALNVAQRRQIALITLGAIAVFAFMRWLPTGTNLNHMDFRVDATNSIDFCDPLNPQFIPVVAVASPVSMSLSGIEGATAGQRIEATALLQTASGKPIAPADLVVTHTERLHLLIVDPTLTDYQHVHPVPAQNPGEWRFAFTPRLGGVYRIFGDFTPAATNRGLYAHCDLPVAGMTHATARTGSRPMPPTGTTHATLPAVEIERDRFELSVARWPIRANQPADLTLGLVRDGGAADVPLQPVMGAFAHLVAFDESASGFAHLHPMEGDVTKAPDARRPALSFKITIPRPGRYVVWAQVNLAGREVFAPFWFDVAE